jgi:nuclear pore complex protein Nup85
MKYELKESALNLVTMFYEDIAPKSWWGILLCDAVDLLQGESNSSVPLPILTVGNLSGWGIDSTLLFSYAGALELLQRLQEIFTRTEQGSGDDYLAILIRTIKAGGEREALNRLKAVRLELARYFARCTVIGVGGKHVSEKRSYAVA